MPAIQAHRPLCAAARHRRVQAQEDDAPTTIAARPAASHASAPVSVRSRSPRKPTPQMMPASGCAAVRAGRDMRSGAVSKALWTRIRPVSPRTQHAVRLPAGEELGQAALREALAADPGQGVLDAVEQARRQGQQDRAGAEAGALRVRREEQGEPEHGADDQPVAPGVGDGRAAARFARHDERRHPARQQQRPRPALSAQRLLRLLAGEGEREEQVRREQRLHQGHLALARARSRPAPCPQTIRPMPPSQRGTRIRSRSSRGERKSLRGACRAAFCWRTKPRPRQQAALTARDRTRTDTRGTSMTGRTVGCGKGRL